MRWPLALAGITACLMVLPWPAAWTLIGLWATLLGVSVGGGAGKGASVVERRGPAEGLAVNRRQQCGAADRPGHSRRSARPVANETLRNPFQGSLTPVSRAATHDHAVMVGQPDWHGASWSARTLGVRPFELLCAGNLCLVSGPVIIVATDGDSHLCAAIRCPFRMSSALMKISCSSGLVCMLSRQQFPLEACNGAGSCSLALSFGAPVASPRKLATVPSPVCALIHDAANRRPAAGWSLMP